MANIFIDLMENEDDFSIKRLKQLFRDVSKKVHPDLVQKEDEYFIRVKEDYDEALQLLAKGSLKSRKIRKEDARVETLKCLFLFSIKVFTKQADVLLNRMIDVSKYYDKRIYDLLKRYNTEMYKNRNDWMRKASVYYSHSIFVACIKQLFQYYNMKSNMNHLLFKNYKQAMVGWSYNIDEKYEHILNDLYSWLENELDNDRIEYYG
jgi:hypothetical protein